MIKEEHPFNILIGNRIAESRRRRYLTQSKLSELTNIKRDAITKYEQGTRCISFENLTKVANALDVSMVYLLGFTDDKYAHYDFTNKTLHTLYDIIQTQEQLNDIDWLNSKKKNNKIEEDKQNMIINKYFETLASALDNLIKDIRNYKEDKNDKNK